jgi:uncharacterized protein with PIN domain
MAKRTAEGDARRAKFLEEAGAAFDRMMKEDQEQMITFDQMEDRALEVGGKLQRWLVEQCLAEAARRKAAAPSACCPQCGKALQFAPAPKERRIRGRTGEVAVERREGYCPSCRKAFFPSGPSVEAGG